MCVSKARLTGFSSLMCQNWLYFNCVIFFFCLFSCSVDLFILSQTKQSCCFETVFLCVEQAGLELTGPPATLRALGLKAWITTINLLFSLHSRAWLTQDTGLQLEDEVTNFLSRSLRSLALTSLSAFCSCRACTQTSASAGEETRLPLRICSPVSLYMETGWFCCLSEKEQFATINEAESSHPFLSNRTFLRGAVYKPTSLKWQLHSWKARHTFNF